MAELGPWRPEDDARLEAAYGQTVDELVAEAERGYCTYNEEPGDPMCGRPAKYLIIWNPVLDSAPSNACEEHMAYIWTTEAAAMVLTAQSIR